MQTRVVSIDEEFELQKSRVKAHPSKTKSGKLTMVKEYRRAGEKQGKTESLKGILIGRLMGDISVLTTTNGSNYTDVGFKFKNMSNAREFAEIIADFTGFPKDQIRKQSNSGEGRNPELDHFLNS